MEFNKDDVMAMMDCSMNSSNLTFTTTAGSTSNVTAGSTSDCYLSDNCATLTGWGYWRDYYYPTVIRESYPVYIRERAKDKGKRAFEIIKILKDKKLVKLEKVSDFIDLMDELIKIL